MAKKPSPLEAELKKQIARIKRVITMATKKGLGFAKDLVPKTPKRVTTKTVERARAITPSEIYKHATITGDHGETLKGFDAVKAVMPESHALPRKPRPTPNPLRPEYQRQIDRIRKLIKRAEQRGEIVPADLIPARPSDITQADIDALKAITPDVFYSRAETKEGKSAVEARKERRVANATRASRVARENRREAKRKKIKAETGKDVFGWDERHPYATYDDSGEVIVDLETGEYIADRYTEAEKAQREAARKSKAEQERIEAENQRKREQRERKEQQRTAREVQKEMYRQDVKIALRDLVDKDEYQELVNDPRWIQDVAYALEENADDMSAEDVVQAYVDDWRNSRPAEQRSNSERESNLGEVEAARATSDRIKAYERDSGLSEDELYKILQYASGVEEYEQILNDPRWAKMVLDYGKNRTDKDLAEWRRLVEDWRKMRNEEWRKVGEDEDIADHTHTPTEADLEEQLGEVEKEKERPEKEAVSPTEKARMYQELQEAMWRKAGHDPANMVEVRPGVWVDQTTGEIVSGIDAPDNTQNNDIPKSDKTLDEIRKETLGDKAGDGTNVPTFDIVETIKERLKEKLGGIMQQHGTTAYKIRKGKVQDQFDLYAAQMGIIRLLDSILIDKEDEGRRAYKAYIKYLNEMEDEIFYYIDEMYYYPGSTQGYGTLTNGINHLAQIFTEGQKLTASQMDMFDPAEYYGVG